MQLCIGCLDISLALKHRLHDGATVVTPSFVVRANELTQRRFGAIHHHSKAMKKAAGLCADLLHFAALERLVDWDFRR